MTPWTGRGLDRQTVEHLFCISRRRANQILVPTVRRQIGFNGVADREEFIQHIERLAAGEDAGYERCPAVGWLASSIPYIVRALNARWCSSNARLPREAGIGECGYRKPGSGGLSPRCLRFSDWFRQHLTMNASPFQFERPPF
jgi:hypothetical protein